jgi:hypothetical protein
MECEEVSSRPVTGTFQQEWRIVFNAFSKSILRTNSKTGSPDL